jgi:FkbM family methyltransferase
MGLNAIGLLHMPNFEYQGKHVEFAGRYTGSYDCINQGKFYEQPFLEYVRSLKLGGTYLDIGTNIGNHALYFAMFCDTQKVIGFEPMASWRERALANLRANGMEAKVDIAPFGLSDRREQLRFNPYGTEYLLQCLPLDAYLPDLAGVTFVKMDIEGSEPKALLGGREFFRRNRPVIFAEALGDPGSLLKAAALIGYRHSGKTMGGNSSPMYELLPA